MSEIDTAALYSALDAHRAARGLSWRDVAAETGLSASTFSRMTHGQLPRVDGYVVMCRWLGMPMETFVHGEPDQSSTLDSELIALLCRRGVDGPDRDFLLSAYRALNTYRNVTRTAA